MSNLSIIIPAKNEEESLNILLPKIKELHPDTEIIVVNDGSSDNTSDTCKKFGAYVIEHPYSLGNGGAIKSGARHASGDILVFMDGDCQHSPNNITNLINELEDGYDMAIAARNFETHSGKRRLIGNIFYNWLASLVVGQNISDLTSGFRAVKAEKFKEFLYLLPNGFSYPTTITMAFFRNGYSVSYVPVKFNMRKGKSHLKLFKDGIRFFVIIVKIASLYSPLKIFTPVSIIILLLALVNYAYTFYSSGAFTNMSALLMIISVIIFFMGLLAEQITTLIYATKPRSN